MSDEHPHRAEDRPVVNGIVALVAVALGVGLILAIVALVGTKVLGIDGGDGSADAGAPAHQSMYLPTPAETTGSDGPLITLATEDTDEPTDSGSTEPSESEPTKKSKSASPKPGEIALQAEQTTVGSGDRIYFSGVYPNGEGAILWVQRWQDGGWVDFPASVGVTNGTFNSYLFTGVSGLNRFRVVDRDTGTVSNEIRVRVQ